MASNGKSFNMKVVRLVKTVDSDIKYVPIGCRMQKLEPKMCGCIRMARHSGNDYPGFGFLGGWPDTPGMFVRVLYFSAASCKLNRFGKLDSGIDPN